MTARPRFTALCVVTAMFMSLPLSALADEATTDTRSEAAQTTGTDRASDARVDDRATTDRRVTDRPVVDRPDRILRTDERPVRRCALAADNPRRCIDQDTGDINVRHLVWRLFQAHEWRHLIKLLMRLGLF